MKETSEKMAVKGQNTKQIYSENIKSIVESQIIFRGVYEIRCEVMICNQKNAFPIFKYIIILHLVFRC